MGSRGHVNKEFLKSSLMQKGGFIKAWGLDPWAGRAAQPVCGGGGVTILWS